MTPIFVDTSAWDAIADVNDKDHILALQFRDEVPGRFRLFTLNYVLDELYTLLLMNIGYQGTVAFKTRLDLLVSEDVLEVIWITDDLASRAWDTFERFNVDKQWSFTDCTSCVVMKDADIREAFAFDHHFEQMGFVLRP